MANEARTNPLSLTDELLATLPRSENTFYCYTLVEKFMFALLCIGKDRFPKDIRKLIWHYTHEVLVIGRGCPATFAGAQPIWRNGVMDLAKTVTNNGIPKSLGVLCLPGCEHQTEPMIRWKFRPDTCLVCTLCLQVVGSSLSNDCLLEHLHVVHKIHILGNPRSGFDVVPWIPEMGPGAKRDGCTTHYSTYISNWIPEELIPTDNELGMIVPNRVHRHSASADTQVAIYWSAAERE